MCVYYQMYYVLFIYVFSVFMYFHLFSFDVGFTTVMFSYVQLCAVMCPYVRLCAGGACAPF